jgi:hypothetical protein
MGLWLKCPGCQAQNPLPLRVCPQCGHNLDKLPAKQRVYVMGPAASPAKAKPAAVAASQARTASPEAGAVPQPAKKPKRTPKKKT